MDAIQQDVDLEVNQESQEEQSSPVAAHDSEIERIAQMVQEGVILDD